ncbi:LamG-like jellyroll fold domain-containing protein [Mesonia aquimarina]|uniref:LamG-like jellyroll fold domain-containing protein n=1 Tax=Mesonia aquimarina TaxID=1504967 RepID=UPI000EF56563|nr:LamG-like jellyroll fold domain-containing protein [Mesonia aquimarina]
MKKTLLNFYVLVCAIFVSNFLYAQTGLHFSGSGDYIQTTYSGVLSNNSRTVEAWVKTESLNNEQIITTWGNENVNGQRFTFRLNASGTNDVIRVEIKGGGFNGTINVNDGLWHHVAVTYDSSLSSDKYKLYVDGVLDTENDITTSLNTTVNTDMIIGRRINASFGGFFSGSMDELRIWDIALTQTEIQNSMNSEACPGASNLVAYYKFNDGIAGGSNTSLTSVSDSSGNANDGTLNNFSLTGSSSNFVTGGTITTTFDETLSTTATDITANQAGATYQWVDCDNANAPITGETSQAFAPTATGNYAVEITDGTCTYITNCVMFTVANSCAAPTNLTAANVDHESAELSWTENGTASDWEVMYGAPGFDPNGSNGTSILVSATAQETIDNLSNGTVYDVYVRADCGNSDLSNWSTVETFTTLAQDPCPAVTGLTATNVTATSADLTWVENGTATSWVVKYGDPGFDPETEGQQVLDDDGTLGVSLTTLSDDTTYEFRVSADCGAGETSDWSAAESFTTEDLSVINENFNSLKLYPNPAKETVYFESSVLVNKITIYNTLGQKVKEATPETLKSNLTISNLEQGVYFVEVKINTSARTYKLIKQ